MDSGSCCNYYSTRLVSKLNLTIIPHPKPYKLQWLNEQGKMIVNQQVKVSFSIGTYKDEVNCDIVPMEAGHILLGRPSQFDRKVTHDGDKNRYAFVLNNRSIMLTPFWPAKDYVDQIRIVRECKLREERLSIQEKKRKEKKNESEQKKEKNKKRRQRREKKIKKVSAFAKKREVKSALMAKK